MSKAVLSMSMSVDGFIAGPNVAPGNGLGDGGRRLHEWFLPDADPEHRTGDHLTGVTRDVVDEAMGTGAVVVGRRTFELADGWGGDHHDGVPIFVLSSRPDVHECAAQARAAAGDGEVMVHGAGAGQALLRAGQLDELELHVVPVLLGQGRRLFDNLPAEHIELDPIRRLAASNLEDPTQHVMHLRYRIHHP